MRITVRIERDANYTSEQDVDVVVEEVVVGEAEAVDVARVAVRAFKEAVHGSA